MTFWCVVFLSIFIRCFYFDEPVGLISNSAQTISFSQRNGCLEKIDSEYRYKKCIIFKRIDTCKHSLLLESWKDHSSPFVIFTLCCTFQGIFEHQTMFYWVWIDFKNLSCLAASDRKVKTLLTITLWLNLTMKSRTTLPHLDKGGGGERHCLMKLLGL